MLSEKSRENRLRRWAERLGYVLHKSRARTIHADNLGGYMLVDLRGNYLVAGPRYNLTPEDVEDWLKEEEQRIRAAG